MIKRRPLDTEYAEFFKTYVDKTEGTDACQMLRQQLAANSQLYQSLSTEQWDYRYEPGKWSIKDVLLHIIDTERVFAYRALRISRGDKTALPGFDQNVFADHARAENRSIESLMSEYLAVRQSSILLFEHMTDEDSVRQGIASDAVVTPAALAFMIAGHEIHHIRILKERYLK